MLPGPESYLPELACVMSNPASYPGGYPPRSIKAAQVRPGCLYRFHHNTDAMPYECIWYI